MVLRMCFRSFLYLILMSSFQVKALDQDGRFVMGAVGDSISTGFNSTGWGDRKRDAWSTGTSSRFVESHFQKLRKIHGAGNVIAFNKARTGSTSRDIIRQSKKLAVHKPDYVTMLIGANDLCSKEGDKKKVIANIRKNVDQSISWLVNANKDVKILLMPIPNVRSLREVGSKMQCKWVWEVTNICRNFLGANRTEEELDHMDGQVYKTNQALAAVQKKFKKNVKFDQSMADVRFSEEWISPRDCFHPSAYGQSLISELSWTTGWFSRL